MSVLRPGALRVWRPLTMRTSRRAASSTPYTGSQYTPVASIATECTPWASSQSRSACSCEVIVPNTTGTSPPPETCMCSLPTSMNAAIGSRTGKCFFMTHLRIELHGVRRGPGPVTSMEKKISPAGKQSSTKMCD